MPNPNPSDAAGLAARRAALGLLHAVLASRQPLDDALDASSDLAAMPARDRAFARLLAATVLRRMGQLDDVVGRTLDRPLKRHAMAVRDVLRLGAAQLLFLATPPHAAVSTAVDLVASVGQDRYGSLVNAVLRRVGREGPAMIAAQDAARLNTPDWLWQSWVGAYGAETAAAIALAHLAEPPLDLTVRGDAAGWAGRLSARLLPTGTLRLDAHGPVTDLPGFAEGAWWVQDAAAALPARLLGPVDRRRVADLCAAPGGKTAQLAAAGARVVAVDRSARRLDRLRRNLDRLGLAAETVVADATRWRPDEPFDAVLVDAPCSATGTMRRHPDVGRLKDPAGLEKLTALQARLLSHAADLVKPGGRLVFCTCSLQPEEGAAQIERLLANRPDFGRDPVAVSEVGGLAEIVTDAGDVRSLPCHAADWGGMDGFAISRLRRAS
ncbi:MAG: RsmB/NOP family class I SAM-dependent RNA methyltransferase [Inquilinaceae bacterium]